MEVRCRLKTSPHFLVRDGATNAVFLGRAGKLFGKAPSDYFELDDQFFNLSIDLACATAYWVDDNHNTKIAKQTAQGEAEQIGSVLEDIRSEMQGDNRG